MFATSLLETLILVLEPGLVAVHVLDGTDQLTRPDLLFPTSLQWPYVPFQCVRPLVLQHLSVNSGKSLFHKIELRVEACVDRPNWELAITSVSWLSYWYFSYRCFLLFVWLSTRGTHVPCVSAPPDINI